MAETTSKLQEQLKALTHGKVDILLDADTFKNTTQILREMSSVWEEMTDMEQAAALELLGGKRQANILSSLISNFETVEDVIETSMNSSGSAIAENEKYMDSIAGKSEQLTNAMQALWNDAINSDMIKYFLDLALGVTKVVDAFGPWKSVLAGVLIYFTAFKKQNPVLILKDMYSHLLGYQQTLYKLNALNKLNVNFGTSGNFNVSAVTAYAAAVSNLTAQKQAEALATSGLNKAQIAEVMSRNGVKESVIQETLSKTNLAGANQVLHTTTVAQAVASQLSTEAMNEQVVADFLAANGKKKLTAEMLTQMVQQKILTSEQAANITSSYALAGANNVLGASFQTVGLAIKSMFLSNPVGLIMMIVSGIAMAVTKAKQVKEEAIQAAKETVSAYEEAQKTLKDQKATIDELSASYERLSNGVDLDTNNNLSLTTDSYKEYLDICNEIADMYPSLVVGYDAQGNAILSLKGNVDELIQAYKEAAQLARQQMIAGGSDVFSAFKTAYDSDPSTVFESTGITQQIKMAEKLLDLINNGSDQEIQYFFDTIEDDGVMIDGHQYKNVELFDTLEAIGIDTSWFNASFQDWMGTVDIDEFKQYASKIVSFLKSTAAKINTETSKVKSLLSAYLGEDLNYASYSDKTRAYIDKIISGLDADFIASFDNADELYNHIKTNIVDAFKDPSVTDAMSELSELQLEFAKGNISYSDYIAQLNEIISKIQYKFDEDTLIQLKVGFGIDEAALETAANHVKTLLYGEDFVGPIAPDIQEKIDSMSVEDLQIAGQLEVPEGVTYSWEELTHEIDKARIAAMGDFNIANYTDAITAHSAAITDYQEALQKLGKGSFTMDDFMELIKKYPELAEGVDISSNAFYGLSRNLNGAIKSSTKSFIKDLKRLRESLVATGKSTDALDQLIESIENMSSDALDDVIQKYGTLANKIDSARMSQDRLSASMEENPNEGYETRGEAIDYMKEALQKGEIGSGSNLWNVAAAYGFTYDSAKTINENADALAQFIAIRERWWKESDDGDGRTNDGYSFKGAENFIKDVESATQSDEFKQAMEDAGLTLDDFIWSYDESTGTFDFDFDNKNWDAIVSALSKTKKLAGLTSDEFANLMEQISQYFGIEWSSYTDAIDHLNEISKSSDDTATKTEEYGKYMQEYFGQNTEIDLTVRPQVSAEDMHDAGWTEFDGDYATLYSSHYDSDDGYMAISVTPILPDGTVLDPKSLEKYAKEIANGTDPAEVKIVYTDEETGEERTYTGEDILLNTFTGPNASSQAAQYNANLSTAQSGYDELRDVLSIYDVLLEKGIDGLKLIPNQKVMDSITFNSKGEMLIDKDAFTAALTDAGYLQDQIDIIIEKIESLDPSVFNFDPLNIGDLIDEKGVVALEEIVELQGVMYKDAKTGLKVFDTDLFTQLLTDAGYADSTIQALIDKILEYNDTITTVVPVAGNSDPLGLNNTALTIDALKASLGALGITFDDTLGTWFDGKRDLTINVTDLVQTLKDKGWTDAAIKAYCTQLAENTEIDGFNIKVDGIENIDEVIETVNSTPEEQTTTFEIIGNGLQTLKDIMELLNSIPAEKKTTHTIEEVTVKRTEEADANGTVWWNPTTWFADGTAHAQGTAFASGSWGASRTETALTGELGPELLVRGNRWTTVGENGAEFTQVKKGDIIFNHKQTESLLKNGYVTSRGKAYAGGTAFAEGGSTFFSYGFSGNGGYTKYDVNNNIVDRFGNAASDISGAASDLSDAADEFNETFDWIEVRIEELDEVLGLLGARLENAVGAEEQNSIIDEMINVNSVKASNLSAAVEEYSAYASKLLNEIPEQYREAAQNGAIAIEEFTGEADEKTLEAIEKYREWAQKVAETTQQVEELKTEIADLAKQKFDNVAQGFDNILDVTGRHVEQYEAMIDYVEESGNIAAPDYYKAMWSEAKKDKMAYEAKRDALQKTLDEAVASGEIEVYSDEWYEMVDAIYEADIAARDAALSMEEYQNAINEIYWDNFDELINRIGYLKDETQNLIDLMGHEDLVVTPETDDGWSAGDVEWTDEGVASLGLYAQQMEMAQYEAEQYAQAIDDLNKDYADGKYSESEYLEKLDELTNGQYESIEAYYEARDAIVDAHKARVDAIKEGIEKEIDAYEELIDKQKEELDAEKDLYDFQKKVAESSKNIADIQRKLAALAGDNSASAIAKRKQLEAELAEAQADQEEMYYERSIDNQHDALDKELEDFKEQKEAEIEMWEDYLENVELIITDTLELVQTNASDIYDTLSEKAEEFGIDISAAILTPWQDGENAVADYQDSFGSLVSSTTEQLDLVKAKWQEVIDKMIEAAGVEIDKTRENNADIVDTRPETPASTPPADTSSDSDTPTEKEITVGGKINAGSAKIYSYAGDTNGAKQYFSSDPIYVVLSEQNGYLKVRHHKLSSGATGWFKKSDVKAYAKGTTGVDEDQWAFLDELGEELVLNAGPDGRLQYLTKGTSVLTHDLTERLMDLAMNPQEVLDRSRPQIAPSKSVVNNNMEIHIDASVGELIHVDRLDGNNLDEINKFVDKAWDKKMQGLNNSLKKFVR